MIARWWTLLVDWLDDRLEIRRVLRERLTERVVPRHRAWHDYLGCFGGLALVFIVMQALSGVFLLMYYVPHPDKAFESVQRISNDVAFGWLVRRVHVVGANFAIALVMAHMVRVLYTGAYKPPREMHWVSGFCLLMFTLFMGFSGYLLPWTQLSYCGATVGTSMPTGIPIVGPYIAEFIRGGMMVTGKTLGRFFALHVCILPAVITAFLVAHFWMIRKTGISEPL